MASAYDDELWRLVPEEAPARPPAHIAAFVRSLPRDGPTLDLGCGDGRLTRELEGAVTAADVSGEALARARRNAPGVTLVELDPDAPLPFADGAFALVVCTETLEHVRDTQLFVSEARRVLRPHGTFAISTPAHGRASAGVLWARGWETGFDPRSPHLRFYSKRSLGGLLDEMGFDVASLATRERTLLARAVR